MPKAAPLRRPPRDEVTSAILDAAIRLFASRGFEATTMQDVAATVGMTAPALYYYFDSKQRLLFEVIERNLTRFNADIEAALGSVGDGDGPAARLAAFVRSHLQFQLEKVDRARVYNAMFLGTGALLDALTTRQRAEILQLQAEGLDRLKAILAEGAAAGAFTVVDVTVTALAIVAMGEFAPAWFNPARRLDVRQIADQYAALAVKMVAPAPGAHTSLRRRRPRVAKQRR